MSILNKFNDKFKVNEFKLFESDYWVWSLRAQQATIGSGILSLKRHCSDFSGLTQEEFSDLGNIIKIIEPTLKKSFSYDVMNYLMLMMVDKHVHYHVIPRYSKDLNFNSKTWSDENWPSVPNLKCEPISEDEAKKIIKEIQNNIQS